MIDSEGEALPVIYLDYCDIPSTDIIDLCPPRFLDAALETFKDVLATFKIVLFVDGVNKINGGWIVLRHFEDGDIEYIWNLTSLTKIESMFTVNLTSRLMGEGLMGDSGNRPVVGMKDIVDPKFAAGDGVLLINPEWDDKAVAWMVREAIKAAKGKSFAVIETGN